MHWLKRAERSLLIVGLVLLGIYVGARIQGKLLSQIEVQRFTSQRLSSSPHLIGTESATGKPSFALLSPKRIQHYEDSLTSHLSPPLAILRIPKFIWKYQFWMELTT